MKDARWPADHAIGVYLCVGGRKTLVATARTGADVGPMLRFLADSWDSARPAPYVDSGWLYDAHAVTSLSV